MNRTLKSQVSRLGRAVAALGACAFIGLSAPHVEARSIPASAGRAANPADSACFALWYSTVTNVCTEDKSFDVPLPVDSAGVKTVRVAGYGPAGVASSVCVAIGMNWEGTGVWGGTPQWLSSGSPTAVVLTDAYVPSYGHLFANCEMDSQARIHSIDWVNTYGGGV